jgi:hypothetical protein
MLAQSRVALSDQIHLTSLPHCPREKGAQEPFESIFVSDHEHFIGQGMVNETQPNCFPLAVCYRTNASRQSTDPTIMCKRGDVFACFSVQFVAGP